LTFPNLITRQRIGSEADNDVNDDDNPEYDKSVVHVVEMLQHRRPSIDLTAGRLRPHEADHEPDDTHEEANHQ